MYLPAYDTTLGEINFEPCVPSNEQLKFASFMTYGEENIPGDNSLLWENL